MMHGYGVVKKLCSELKDFMKAHNFSSIEDFRGYALYLRTHFMNHYCNIIKQFLAYGTLLLFLFSFFWWFPRVSLQYFTTHTDLVRRQKEAIEQRKAVRKGLQSDKDWTGDGFVKETESMVSN